MSARGWLVVYLTTVVALTFVHDPICLALALAVFLAASGPARWALARRALLAVLVFNLSISISYIAAALWQGHAFGAYLLLANLRVYSLVFLGFWFVDRVNLLQALEFSRTLSFVATLAVGQVAVFSRIVRDFRLAFISRNPAAATVIDRARHASAQADHLLAKSASAAAETAMTMRSRGCFDD